MWDPFYYYLPADEDGYLDIYRASIVIRKRDDRPITYLASGQHIVHDISSIIPPESLAANLFGYRGIFCEFCIVDSKVHRHIPGIRSCRLGRRHNQACPGIHIFISGPLEDLVTGISSSESDIFLYKWHDIEPYVIGVDKRLDDYWLRDDRGPLTTSRH